MAKKALTYREILLAVKKKEFAPIYLLSGNEPYYLDLICAAIEKYAIDDTEKDFNCDIFYGQDADLDMISASARQFPFMSDRRLVILKEAQNIHGGKPTLEKLEGYMQRPSEHTVFVIVYKGDVLSATSKIVKAANANGGVVFASQKVRDYNLPSIIKDYCREQKVQIDDKSTQLLAEYVGTDLSKLFGEIDKLLVALGKESPKRITPEAIERNIGISKDYNVFELIDALSSNNYAKAMRITDAFSKNPKQNSTHMIVPNIFAFYQNMAIITMERDKSDQNLMNVLGLKNSWSLKNLKQALSHINFVKAVNCVNACREFDAKNKGIGSMQDDFALFKELIFKLFSASNTHFLI